MKTFEEYVDEKKVDPTEDDDKSKDSKDDKPPKKKWPFWDPKNKMTKKPSKQK